MNKQQFIDLGIAADLAEKAAAASAQELEGYVATETHNQVIQERDQFKGQVADRDLQIETIKKETPDNTELQNKILTMQADNKTKDENHAKEVEGLKLQHRIDLKLHDKARNPQAAKGLKALLDMDKIKINGDGLDGIDDQLEALEKAEDTSFYFKTQQSSDPKFTGASVAEGGDKTNENKSVTLSGALAAHFNKGQN